MVHPTKLVDYVQKAKKLPKAPVFGTSTKITEAKLTDINNLVAKENIFSYPS